VSMMTRLSVKKSNGLCHACHMKSEMFVSVGVYIRLLKQFWFLLCSANNRAYIMWWKCCEGLRLEELLFSKECWQTCLMGNGDPLEWDTGLEIRPILCSSDVM